MATKSANRTQAVFNLHKNAQCRSCHFLVSATQCYWLGGNVPEKVQLEIRTCILHEPKDPSRPRPGADGRLSVMAITPPLEKTKRQVIVGPTMFDLSAYNER